MSVERKPSIGRIVHYIQKGVGKKAKNIHFAAIVADVNDGLEKVLSINLCVFTSNGFLFVGNVVEDQEAKGAGSWHWPERD